MSAFLLFVIGFAAGASDAVLREPVPEPCGPPAPVRPAEPFRLRLPEPLLRAALEAGLREHGQLERFQIGPSKFLDGRVHLDRFELVPGAPSGAVRFEVRASVVYTRRQWGVEWRGFKSRSEWIDKGPERVAKVRLTGEVRVAAGERPALEASRLRVKIESRLRPVAGLTARFDLGDRTYALPGDQPFLASVLERLRIERTTADAIWLVERRVVPSRVSGAPGA